MSHSDEIFMAEALKLAVRGRGHVEPNPMVGAILVRDDEIIGRGWHKKFGGPHAEREALADARQRGANARGATMYVTLEPCCHHGKTPPCTEAVMEAGISRLVMAIQDPDPKVAGGGLAQLRQAGVDVVTGVCQREAQRLLAPYVKLRARKRPWVICKWAQTSDGYLALPPNAGRWISSEQSRTHLHKLRSLCDGILVGISTVLADDPLLTNRCGSGAEKQPTRVVLDSSLRTPLDCKLMQTARETPVIIATAANAADESHQAAGAEVLHLPAAEDGVSLEALLDELGRRQWIHLLVEGGPAVLGSFINQGLADELLVYVSPTPAGAASDSQLPRLDIAEAREKLSPIESAESTIGPDKLLRLVLTD